VASPTDGQAASLAARDAHAASNTPAPLDTARAWLDSHASELTGLADRIWRYAEPGLREYRAARALCDYLRQHGFRVDEGVAHMPTAFVGTYGSGGPVIGLMCEYDATPGDSQYPVPEPAPIAPDACGFPDLHNGIGAASVGAAAAIRAAMETHGLSGTIRVFGTPAEKICVGKPFLARDGYFDGLDAVVAWHPRPYTTAEWDGGPGCYQAEIFNFHGVSTYGATPWTGVSALDALTLMNVIVQFMREHIPRQYLATVNELITAGGQHPTSLPAFAQVWYVYRSPRREGVVAVQEMLGRAAEAACLATGARYERQIVASTRPWVPNHTLAMLCYRNLQRAGAPAFPEESKAFARKILAKLGLPDDPEPFDERISPPDKGVTGDRAGGTDDVSEFCWHAPTARIYVAHGPRVGRQPNWVGASLAGTIASHTTVMAAARAVALSALDVLLSPEDLAAARREFEERTAGHRMPPLLPADAVPPVDVSFAPHYPTGWRPPADREIEA
jgi:aminobenzoyl-glutamate utilization protein B